MLEDKIVIEVIGYCGAIINTVSALPQVIKTFKTKNVESLSLVFLTTWFIGCLLLLIYTLCTHVTVPVLINYLLNVILPLILIYMYFKYKK